MQRKVFIALVAIVAALVINIGAHAAKPQPSVTCALWPGDTVVSYPGGTSRIALDWFDSNGVHVGGYVALVRGVGTRSDSTPEGAVRYVAQIDINPVGVKTTNDCN